jgi:hypothetical protein
MLIQLIQGNEPANGQVVLEPALVVRRSSGGWRQEQHKDQFGAK